MINTTLQKPAERDFYMKYINLSISSLLFGDSGQRGILTVQNKGWLVGTFNVLSL